MRAAFLLVALGLAAVAAVPANLQRVAEGSITSIDKYPFGVALLLLISGNFRQMCGGSIINNRSILTAAHCLIGESVHFWRARVGSTYANSGGVVHTSSKIINHPDYDDPTLDNDIAILHIVGTFSFNENVGVGYVASGNYNILDNSAVWAIGWGMTRPGGPQSRELRHVELWIVNQAICKSRYAEIRSIVTDNMICAGHLDVSGRGTCTGDSGGPLIHKNVIVGITSWSYMCQNSRYPGVRARVSRYTTWIESHA